MIQPNKKPQFAAPKIPSFNAPDIKSFVPPTEGVGGDTEDLKKRVEELENYIYGRIGFETDIIGLFETVSTPPTHVPYSPYDQVKIYVSGATYRLYWYDGNANAWHYVTATA